MTRKEIEEILERLDARFPDDYMELIQDANGFMVRDISVLAIEDVYEVMLPLHTYYFLADVPDQGTLVVRKNSQNGLVYFLTYHVDEEADTIESFTTFREAVERVLSR